MVAISGSGWKLAPSLVALINETDRRFPTRDHSSDGSIGDAAHASRESQHNPENGWVCAVDIDENLSPTLDSLQFLCDVLIDRRDHRVRYLIYERRIVKSYVDQAGRAAWVWQPYTGLNDHSKHLHVSVWNTPAARDDTGPWWPEEDEFMALSDAEQKELLDKVRRIFTAIGSDDKDTTLDARAKETLLGVRTLLARTED